MDNHEAYLMGALLTDPLETLKECEGLVTSDSFLSETLKTFWSAAEELRKEGEGADIVMLSQKARRMGVQLSREEIKEYIALCPSLTALGWYAERVAEAAEGRALRAAMLDACQRLADGDAVGLVLPEMEAAMSVAKARGKAAIVSSDEAMHETYKSLMNANSSSLFLPTGYSKLNKILGGGFIKAGLHILAARPGTGKTTLALQIAESVAARNIPTLFISLEMGVDQLQYRRLAMDAGVPLGEILNISPSDKSLWQKVNASTAKLSARPFFFNRVGTLSVPRIERLARSSGARFVVIDYLGLIQHSGTRSIYEKVTETSNALKRMAIALNIPILCLCQLNRESDGKAPKVSELRDSGAIEQDADTICLQWLPGGRPEEGKHNGISPVELSLIVAKNRHGAQGKLALDWYMNCGRIRE